MNGFIEFLLYASFQSINIQHALHAMFTKFWNVIVDFILTMHNFTVTLKVII